MSEPPRLRPVGALKKVAAFRDHLAALGITMGVDDGIESGPSATLAQPYRLRDGFVIGNRFCIHPMEGWDGTEDGRPSELTRRRWIRFGDQHIVIALRASIPDIRMMIPAVLANVNVTRSGVLVQEIAR